MKWYKINEIYEKSIVLKIILKFRIWTLTVASDKRDVLKKLSSIIYGMVLQLIWKHENRIKIDFCAVLNFLILAFYFCLMFKFFILL